MAYPAVRAVTSGQTNATSTSISCTHPTGLTAGDLMVLFVHIYNQASNTRTITTPATWTLQQTVNGLADAQSNGKVLACFTKVATAGDVSAGSTTVSFTSAEDSSYAFYAISNTAVGAEVAGVEGDNEQETSVTTGSSSYVNSFTTNITTQSIESLVIGCFATTIFNVPDTPALGSSTMVLTPSSTVTSDINIAMTDAGGGATGQWLYAGSAQYAENINITSRQITVVSNGSISSHTLETSSIIIAINPPTSRTADVSRIELTPTLYGVTGSNTATATVGHVEIEPELHSITAKSSSQGTQWVNETKPTTNWTNDTI